MAQRDPNYRLYFDFIESRLLEASIEGATASIVVTNLGVWPGHPHYPIDGFDKCRLIFEGVAKSVRTTWEYVGEPPQELGSKHTIVDGPFPAVETVLYTYRVEGVYLEGSKEYYLLWDLESQSYRIEEIKM